MVSSEGEGRADVWSAEASLNCEDVDVPADEGGGVDVAELFIIDAVAMDSRERTRSSGYVVPAKNKIMLKKSPGRAACQMGDEQTEVMPARAPLANRVGVSSCFSLCKVNHWGQCYQPRQLRVTATHLLELFIRRELDGTIRYDSNAIDPIPSHETLEALLFPYANETSPHSRVLLARVPRLNLSTDESVRHQKYMSLEIRTG
jgi:hypothetical protein